MVPNLEFPTVTPFSFHVTDVFMVLVTAAVNCFVVFTRAIATNAFTSLPVGRASTTPSLATLHPGLPIAGPVPKPSAPCGFSEMLLPCTNAPFSKNPFPG
jgi:hypothetical protein